jgi:hypothetical protein
MKTIGTSQISHSLILEASFGNLYNIDGMPFLQSYYEKEKVALHTMG